MRFISFILPSEETRAELVERGYEIIGLVGKWIGILALAGLILTGLALHYFSRGAPFPYPTMWALHVFCGLLYLVDCLYRLLRAGMHYRYRRGWSLWGRWTGPGLVSACYRILITMLLLSGWEVFVQQRYGWSLLPVLPLAWSKVHGLLFFFFPVFLLLRLFYWGRARLKAIRPYLLSP